jgi:hypothetical protein
MREREALTSESAVDAIAEPIARITARGNGIAADGSNHERNVVLTVRDVRESAMAEMESRQM